MTSPDTVANNPGAADPVPWSRVFPPLLLGLVVLLHVLFLMSRFAPAIVTPDANGYWAQGSLLAKTGRTWFRPEADPQYIGMHWLVTPDGRYFSRYPPGLAVLVAAVQRLFGYPATVLINPLLAAAALLGLYALSRRFVTWPWALTGVLALAVVPTFNQHALSCDSHMAVTALLTWGCYFLVRWGQNGSLAEAFLAGLTLGAIPTVRYPEALYGLGVGAFLLLHWRSRPRIWRHYLAAVAGAAVPLLPLLIRNQLAFGAFWRTAYALTNEQSGFAWSYFRQHFVNYIRQLHGDGVGLFFPLGLVGMVLMCGVRKLRPVGVLLVLLAVPVTLLYMAYYWGPQNLAGATMRFVLPTFVCYLVAGLWCLQTLTATVTRPVRVAVIAALVLGQGIWGGFSTFYETRHLAYQKKALAVITKALEAHTVPDDVILASNQILQHLDFVRHWRLADPGTIRERPEWRRRIGDARSRDRDAPAPMQSEKEQIQAEKYKGLRPFGRERAVAWDLREWAQGHKVYWVGSEQELDMARGYYFGRGYLREVARIALPEQPKMPTPEGLMGAGLRFGPGPGGPGQPGAGPAGGAAPPGPGPNFPPDGAAPPGGQGFGPGGNAPGGVPGVMARAAPGGAPPGAGPGPGFGFQGRPGFGRGGPGGGGPGPRWGFPNGEKEFILCEWTWTPPAVEK